MKIEKTVKVYKQRALVMTLPVAMIRDMDVELGDTLHIEYDSDEKQMKIKKATEETEIE